MSREDEGVFKLNEMKLSLGNTYQFKVLRPWKKVQEFMFHKVCFEVQAQVGFQGPLNPQWGMPRLYVIINNIHCFHHSYIYIHKYINLKHYDAHKHFLFL